MLLQLVSSFNCTLRLLCHTYTRLPAVRRPAINDRLAAVARGEAVTFLKETDERERPLNTWAVGINWERFSQEDLVEIVEVSLRFPSRTQDPFLILFPLHSRSASEDQLSLLFSLSLSKNMDIVQEEFPIFGLSLFLPPLVIQP